MSKVTTIQVPKDHPLNGYKLFTGAGNPFSGYEIGYSISYNKRYMVGKTYHEDTIELRKHGMHFCTKLLDCFKFCVPLMLLPIGKVQAWGTIQYDEDGNLCASDMKIVEEVPKWYNDEKLQLDLLDLPDVLGRNVPGIYFCYLVNPSNKVKLKAVRIDPRYIKSIKNPTEQVQLIAVQANPNLYTSIDKPTEKVTQLHKKLINELHHQLGVNPK